MRWRWAGAAVVGLVAVAGLLGVRPVPSLAQRAGTGHPAPEVAGGPWLNSEPLTMAGLRGQVVLVEFWTYG